MATDRTNAPATGVHTPVQDNSIHIPAFLYNNPQGLSSHANSSPNAGLSVFDNPVQGHVDTGVTHEGDMGRLS